MEFIQTINDYICSYENYNNHQKTLHYNYEEKKKL